jgi:hypothetical protein
MGQTITHEQRKISQVMDARIECEYSSHEAIKVAHVAIRCLSAEQKYRPNIEEVVRSLEQLQDSNDKTNGHSLSSSGSKQHGKSVDESLSGEGTSNMSSYDTYFRRYT